MIIDVRAADLSWRFRQREAGDSSLLIGAKKSVFLLVGRMKAAAIKPHNPSGGGNCLGSMSNHNSVTLNEAIRVYADGVSMEASALRRASLGSAALPS